MELSGCWPRCISTGGNVTNSHEMNAVLLVKDGCRFKFGAAVYDVARVLLKLANTGHTNQQDALELRLIDLKC